MEEHHQVMNSDLASKPQEALPEKPGNDVTASDIVPSTQKEKKKKDKDIKKEKKGEKQKKDTKKKETVQKDGDKKKNNKRNKEKKIKKVKDGSSSSSSSSSESDDDGNQPKPKKAKNKDKWIWWGVLGGLVLVIGGVLKIVNASKEQVDSQRQVEGQVPIVLREHGEREITKGDLRIEELTITDIGNISGGTN